MALTNEFNQLAGKIVSKTEFKFLLEQAGVDKNSGPSQEQIVRKASDAYSNGKLPEVMDLMNDVDSSMFLTSKSLAKIIKKKLRQKDDLNIMTPALGALIRTNADSLYLRVQPLVKMTEWACNDKKIVDAFIKAAEDCTDHRNRTDLHEVQPVMLTKWVEKMMGKKIDL